MAAGFVIVQIKVTNPDVYDTYRAGVAESLVPFGGTFLVRGGPQDILEGTWLPRTVVLRFPSVDAAKAWHASDGYASLKALRQSASVGKMVVVEGVE